MILSLLDPRVWLFVAAVGAAGYLKGCHDGRDAIQKEVKDQAADAAADARRLEQKRQDAADAAARLAAQREAGIRADAVRARTELGGLRDDLNAIQRASADSLATANNAIRTLGDVLQSCAAEYQRVAEEADRATSEALTLRQAWPR